MVTETVLGNVAIALQTVGKMVLTAGNPRLCGMRVVGPWAAVVF